MLDKYDRMIIRLSSSISCALPRACNISLKIVSSMIPATKLVDLFIILENYVPVKNVNFSNHGKLIGAMREEEEEENGIF